MRCKSCGCELNEGARFCPVCGAAARGAAEEAPGSGRVPAPAPAPTAASSPAPALVPGSKPLSRRVPTPLLVALACAASCALGFAVTFLLVVPFLRAGAPADADADAPRAAQVVIRLSDVDDAAWRSYLSKNADTDGDGSISRTEADAVTAIGSYDESAGTVSGGLAGAGVKELDDLEDFPNLEVLVVTGNRLDELELEHNTRLVCVAADDNALTEVDLPRTGTLRYLSVTGNRLGSIDVSGLTGLTVLRRDDSVRVGGAGASPDAAAQEKLEDLALIAGTANAFAGDVDLLDGGKLGSARTTPGNGAVDANLIYGMANAGSVGLKGAYGMRVQGTSAFIPVDRGRKVISSVYGSAPEDLSYISKPGSLAFIGGSGSGWTFSAAQGGPGWTAKGSDWVAYGNVVEFVVTLSELNDNVPAGSPGSSGRQSLRVRAVKDENSMFGYHLVSMEPVSGA